MKFNIYPEGKFVVATEMDIESENRLTLPNGQSDESYCAFKIEKVGGAVNDDRDGESVLLPDDIVLVKRSDVNFVNFLGDMIAYIDHSFAIKIKIL